MLDESLFEAIDVIITHRLEDNQHFDKTWFCTITDASSASLGLYIVEHEGKQYKVISDLSTYKEGDAVRVTIPNGDINGVKSIAGKYSTAESSMPIDYMAPMEQVLQVLLLV